MGRRAYLSHFSMGDILKVYLNMARRHVEELTGAPFNVTHFESRITHLLYTAINTAEHS
jgi:hypothetical protein